MSVYQVVEFDKYAMKYASIYFHRRPDVTVSGEDITIVSHSLTKYISLFCIAYSNNVITNLFFLNSNDIYKIV